MIWVLITAALLLIIAGSYTAGVITSPWVLAKLMPATGAHTIPACEVIPAQVTARHDGTREPRSAPFALEPPRSRRADLPVRPARTTGPQPWETAPLAAVPDEPGDDHDVYQASYQAERGDYGTRPQLEVLADEQRAEVAW